jgi:hypothetical protein
MAENLSKTQRSKIAKADYAWPDEDKYPIRNQGELDSCAKLIGRAPAAEQAKIRARAMEIAKRKGLSLPDTWKEAKAPKMAKSKVAIDMTTDDLHSALQGALDAEHGDKQGPKPWVHAVKPLASEMVYHDGNDLLRRSYSLQDDGSVKIDGEPEKVKRRTVYEPLQVTMSFSSVVEHDGEVELSGVIFEAGDYPDKGVEIFPEDILAMERNFKSVPIMIEHIETPFDEAFAGFGLTGVTASEDAQTLSGKVRIPKLLDLLLTKAMGKAPRKVSVRLSPDKSRITELSFVRDPRVENAAIQAAYSSFTTAFSQGESSAKPARQRPERNKPNMRKSSLADRFKALFSKSAAEDIEEIGITEEEIDAVFSQGSGSGTITLDASTQREIEALRSNNAALVAGRVHEVAAKFADDAIKDGSYFSGDREMLEGAFLNAIKVDAAGVFTFGATGVLTEGAEAKKLRESVTKRPKTKMTKSLMGREVLVFGDAQVSEEQKEKAQRGSYFSGSGSGRAVLAQEKKD